MKRLNILYLIRCWEFGGSHSIMLHLMQHLPAERYTIVCVPYDAFTEGDRLFIAQAEKRGLTIAEDRVPWRSRRDWGRARDTVNALIEKYDIDLLHTHDPHSNVMIGIGRDRWPCACVASSYGWWDGVIPFRRFVNQCAECYLSLKNFDRVITVSHNMKKRILRGPTPEARIRVIPTGFDPSPLRFAGDCAEARRKLGLPNDAIVVGTVSRVSVEKGHRYLLDAAVNLVRANPKAHFLIVGNGPAKADLEAQVKRLGLESHVTMTGFCEDLPAALASIDIFAQPSIEREGLPTSVLEAESVGLPIVASDIGGTSETLIPGETGLLVKPASARALEVALGDLLGNASRRQAMGAAAQVWFDKSFTLERMIEQVCATYDEAMEAYARRH